MKINQLLEQQQVIQYIGNLALLNEEIIDLSYNTKTARPGVVFFAMKGKTVDGARFIPNAYEAGARIFVCQSEVAVPEDALLVIVENDRIALSLASHRFFGEPSKKLKVIGITGTKGKTTTTTLLFKVLTAAGEKAGVIGTNGIFYNDVFLPTANTTPESYDIHRVLAMMVDAGVTSCFMEVSSQGLMMGRVEHVKFACGVFTNMAHDHIGELEHPTFENYLYWKTHLFDLANVALVNVDDAHVNAFIQNPSLTVKTYGIDNAAQYQATQLAYDFDGQKAGMSFLYENQLVHLPVPGKFNVYNALVVLAIGDYLNLDSKKVIQELHDATVSGRMEVVPNDKGVLALLDFAHNGFALENVLTTLQHYDYNRLFVLFGSVGDRSQTRRKELGDVVAKYADVAIVTSDNPGFENPNHIIDDICESFVDSDVAVYREPDREVAIHLAISLAEKGDIIVFAGKGHETYQLIKDEKQPFVEREIIQQAFTAH